MRLRIGGFSALNVVQRIQRFGVVRLVAFPAGTCYTDKNLPEQERKAEDTG